MPYSKLMVFQDNSFLRGVSDIHPSFSSAVVAGISLGGISSSPLSSPNLNSLSLATVHCLRSSLFVTSAPVSFLGESKVICSNSSSRPTGSNHEPRKWIELPVIYLYWPTKSHFKPLTLFATQSGETIELCLGRGEKKGSPSSQALVSRFSRLRDKQNAQVVCISLWSPQPILMLTDPLIFPTLGIKEYMENIAARINSQFRSWKNLGFMRISVLKELQV